MQRTFDISPRRCEAKGCTETKDVKWCDTLGGFFCPKCKVRALIAWLDERDQVMKNLAKREEQQ